MTWLTRLFARRPDPLAVLRDPPCMAEEMAIRAELLEETCLDLLRQGEHLISAHPNVDSGTPGYALVTMQNRGWMGLTLDEVIDDLQHYRYSATPLGLKALAIADQTQRIECEQAKRRVAR
jgi:hypothetical protein